MIQSLYTPQSNRPMHVAVFGSGGGTNARALIAAGTKEFEIKLLYTNRDCNFQQIAKDAGIPLIENFRGERTREEQDERGIELISLYSIDFIFLAGYMQILSSSWLHAFPERILNVHPADLTHLDSAGKRAFVGDNAVALALSQGMNQTRSSVILIDEGADTGPLLVSGPWVTYAGGTPKEHQERQKEASDWPAAICALQLIAQGRMALDGTDVYVDGQKQPPCGYELREYESIRK